MLSTGMRFNVYHVNESCMVKTSLVQYLTDLLTYLPPSRNAGAVVDVVSESIGNKCMNKL